MKTLLAIACICTSLYSPASTSRADAQEKKYEPSWESIDSRTTPSWWTDAKFGIFIHWGPYSVPAFSKVGTYSEWYWETLVNPQRDGGMTRDFHNRIYGESFTYPDFVPMFTCEMFEPDRWAKLFADSGAKYVVLTSKHHDGYCLWESEEANKSWGRPWNSVDTGPERDLVGELTDAVRKTDVKMGLYYSLYEWRNPLYVADPELYADKVMVPQFKEIVEKYAPAVIFADGEWDHPESVWRSLDILSWLYNKAPNRAEVVINDRWGRNLRHKHGGYYTTEYGAGLPNADHAWEENRGMAHSFGYSRTENFEDYNSTQQLLYMLIDIVSRGGNFLLDIGPTADGRVPVIMQERLLEMGDWLEVNGEAIYGTQTWTKTCQWTDGDVREAKHGRVKDGTTRGKYDVMKLTVNPDPGQAIKEIFFTRKGDTLYCICAVLPDEQLTVKDVQLGGSAKVSLLGIEGALKAKQDGENVVITLPRLNPSKLPCDHAWVLKIEGVRSAD